MGNDASYMVGDVASNFSGGITTCVATFWVLEQDLDLFIPENPGETVPDWLPERHQGKGIVIQEWDKSFIGPGCYMVTITADNNSDTSGSMSSTEALLDKVTKNYSNAQIFFPLSWWGIRKATRKDIEKENRGEPIKRLKLADGNTYEYYRAYIRAFAEDNSRTNEVYTVGEYIFNDAVPRIIVLKVPDTPDGKPTEVNSGSDPTTGSADYTKSPFKNTPAIPIAWAELNQTTTVYTCTFYTQRSTSDLAEFCGVSGSKAFPKKCTPMDGDTAGKWRAVDQQMEEIKDSNGQTLMKVTRKMERAPGDLLWDASKNGGTWKW